MREYPNDLVPIGFPSQEDRLLTREYHVLPKPEISREWPSHSSLHYRWFSRLVQELPREAHLAEQLASFMQQVISEDAPWPIDSCMILDGQCVIQPSAPLAAAFLTSDERAVLLPFLERARQDLLEPAAGGDRLLSLDVLPLVNGSSMSQRTVWFVPLPHQRQIVGVLRLVLREEQGASPDPIGWFLAQREAFRLLLDLVASTLFHHPEPFARMVHTAISYGLRTPLTVLQLTVSNLLNEGPWLQERHANVHLLHEQVVRLNTCIANLLTLCDLETQQLLLQPRWSSLEDLLIAITSKMQQEGRNKAIRLILSPDLPLLPFDPVAIERVLTTLLHQTIRSLPDEVPAVVEVQIEQEAVLLSLFIGETTIGQELGAETNSLVNQNRWWLDFTMSSRLMAAHGGQLWMERRKEESKKIWLRFPRGMPGENSPQGEEPQRHRGRRRREQKGAKGPENR